MTADRLDEETEQGIRERCPLAADSDYHDDPSLMSCTCSEQRAAILADREARQKAERDRASANA